jgi:hypothetical protein
MSQDDSRKEELQSLRRQLANAKKHLLSIRERKTEYIQAESIPLDLINNERRWENEIARLEQEIGENSNEFDLQAENTRLQEKVVRLEKEVARLTQDNEELRVAMNELIEKATREEIDEFNLVLISIIRKARDLANTLTRNCELSQASTLARAIARDLDRARALARVHAREHVRNLDFAWALARGDHTLAHNRTHTLIKDHARVRNLFEKIDYIGEEELSPEHPEVITFKEAVEEFNKRVQEQQQRSTQ